MAAITSIRSEVHFRGVDTVKRGGSAEKRTEEAALGVFSSPIKQPDSLKGREIQLGIPVDRIEPQMGVPVEESFPQIGYPVVKTPSFAD